MEKKEPSAADYYRSWIAFEALKEATASTSYRSVWKAIDCKCCPEPQCWKKLPVLSLPSHLHDRIRWYDNHRPSEAYSVMGLTPDELHSIRDHFVSHHQRIELILVALKPSMEKICELMKPFQDDPDRLTDQDADAIVAECKYVANGWVAVGLLIEGVAKLDRITYLKYVPSLAGVSGGNSPNMMALTAKAGSLESYFTKYADEQLASAIWNCTPAGRIAEAFIDILDALSRCWFNHVVTATTAIGITAGTKGTPNTILADRVLRRLHGSRLLKALGSLRSPITGIGTEMKQLHNYDHYPLASHYLDLFVDPGPEFGTHSIGVMPKTYEEARSAFLKIRRSKRTALWEHFYAETRPAFCEELGRLLGLNDPKSSDTVGFGLGSSVTEVLSRLIASLRQVNALEVVLADDEFVTLQRVTGILSRNGASITRVQVADLENYVVQSCPQVHEEKKDHGIVRQLVLVSMVNSCTQRVTNLDWILDIEPSEVIFVVDITQAVANIPLRLAALASRPNVFLVGSLIKHARCGEGLGFMTYSRADDRIIQDPASGWTAYLSGLRENKTVNIESNQLLYDVGLEWDGGTPSWAEAAFVATRILEAMPPIEEQYEYVKGIKEEFLTRASSLLSSDQRNAVSESNTMAFPVTRVVTLPFGMDHKIVNSTSYLRIGFGIHNLPYHLGALVDVLEKSGALAE